MKRTLPYFSHYNDTRTTIPGRALLNKYGMEGYGRYNILLEIIASCPDAKLDMNFAAAKYAVAHELQMNNESLKIFIDFLSSRNECGFLSYEDGILENDQLRENYNTVKAERSRKREEYKERTNASNEFSMEDGISESETARKNADDIHKESKQINKQIEIEKGGIGGKDLGANLKYCPDCGDVLVFSKAAGGPDEYGCKRCRSVWIRDRDSGELKKHGEYLPEDSEVLKELLINPTVPQHLRDDLLRYRDHDDQGQ